MTEESGIAWNNELHEATSFPPRIWSCRSS
jgi:hypothetical protein